MTKVVLGSALREITGPLADLHQKLAGPDGNLVWLPALKRFLRKEDPWAADVFPLWKVVIVGNLKSVDEALQELRNVMEVREYLGKVIRKGFIPTTEGIHEVDITRLTVEQLGFPQGTSYPVLNRRIKQIGLELCTTEIAIAIRLAYLNQHDPDEMLSCAMEPIVMDDGYRTFIDICLDDNDGLGINAPAFDDLPGPDVEVLCVVPRH